MELEFKDLEYWKNNAEEDYLHTPISVLKYITELENSTTDLLEAVKYTLEKLKYLDGHNPTEKMIINKCEKAIEKSLL